MKRFITGSRKETSKYLIRESAELAALNVEFVVISCAVRNKASPTGLEMKSVAIGRNGLQNARIIGQLELAKLDLFHGEMAVHLPHLA